MSNAGPGKGNTPPRQRRPFGELNASAGNTRVPSSTASPRKTRPPTFAIVVEAPPEPTPIAEPSPTPAPVPAFLLEPGQDTPLGARLKDAFTWPAQVTRPIDLVLGNGFRDTWTPAPFHPTIAVAQPEPVAPVPVRPLTYATPPPLFQGCPQRSHPMTPASVATPPPPGLEHVQPMPPAPLMTLPAPLPPPTAATPSVSIEETQRHMMLLQMQLGHRYLQAKAAHDAAVTWQLQQQLQVQRQQWQQAQLAHRQQLQAQHGQGQAQAQPPVQPQTQARQQQQEVEPPNQDRRPEQVQRTASGSNLQPHAAPFRSWRGVEQRSARSEQPSRSTTTSAAVDETGRAPTQATLADFWLEK